MKTEKLLITLILCLVIGSGPILAKASSPIWTAATLYDSSNFKVAIYHLNKALALDPHNVHIMIDLSLSYDSLGNHSQAAIYYNRVLSSPDDIHYLASKGVAADNLGDHVEAIF